MSPEQALQAGNAFARAHLEIINGVYGPDVACAYANGLAWFARDFVFHNKCPLAAYEMLQELADGAAVTILLEGA